MLESAFYLQHFPRFQRVHRQMIRLYGAALRERFGTQAWQAIVQGADAGFRTLLLAVPYIGGSANPFTRTLVQAASLLALWRELEPRGVSRAEFGSLTNQVVPSYLARYPRWLLGVFGRLYASRIGRRRLERQARRSQARLYPGDFVFTVVDGQPGSFAWGMDYSACGVVKFLASQGAEFLGPFMCTLDYAAFAALGIDLKRGGTLAAGSGCCDFRFALRK